ncbi:ribonuclease P protein component [Patescibacteria group bacterium]|nr:ribonuclease P protein component [Patescibacteria group bacterium]MBU4142750.1 ribonuclease P protein component [Patescibacteria group bacterium]
MLSKIHRLNKKKDFDNIFQQGDLAQDSFLAVRFLPNQKKTSRFGLVVSAKTAPKATDRNRLKRQLSEVIRRHLKKIKTGIDFVLVVKAKLAGADYNSIEAALLNLLEKKKLYV